MSLSSLIVLVLDPANVGYANPEFSRKGGTHYSNGVYFARFMSDLLRRVM
jgi:hypothetical protein